MRVAVFIKRTTFHENYGGLETQNLALCDGLVKRGHSVTVFSPKWELTEDSKELNGVKYIFIPCVFRFLLSFRSDSWVNRSYQTFAKLHNNDKFGLAIGQSSAALGIIRHKKELKIKVISISHGSIAGELATRIGSLRSFREVARLIPDTGYVLVNFFGRQREFILNSDRVIAVSNTVKEKIVDETFVPEERVVVIHNGLNEFSLDNANEKTEEFKLIYVGKIISSKGLTDLAKALADEKLKDAVLDIVGDGDYKEKLKKEIRDFGVEDKVNFVGPLEHGEVSKALRAADVFVLPSKRKEGFPMTLVEAMFAGLPIVASKSGGIVEAVDDRETGFLIEPGSVSQLQNKIVELKNSPDLRKRMGKSALQKARNEFSIDLMLNKYEQVFNEVLG